MDELLEVSEAHLVELPLEEILHSLDIMVGHLLDVLDGLGVGVGEVTVNVAQSLSLGGHAGQLRTQRLEAVGEGDEILHLHADTVFYQRPFGEILGQGLAFGTIAPVDGRHGIETIHRVLFKNSYLLSIFSTLRSLLSSTRAWAYRVLWVSVPMNSTHPRSSI